MFSTPTPTSVAEFVSPTAAEVDQYQTAFRQLAKGGSDISASRAQRFLARSRLPEAVAADSTLQATIEAGESLLYVSDAQS